MITTVVTMGWGDRWKNSEILVSIDRALLNYLANLTKFSHTEILSSIKDCTTAIVERVKEKDLAHSTKRTVFPGTDVKVTFSAACNYDQKQYWKDDREWHKKLVEATGITSTYDANNAPAPQRLAYHKWIKSNPRPDSQDQKYYKIICRVSLPNNTVTFSVDQIDHLIMEEIFFGKTAEEVDDD